MDLGTRIRRLRTRQHRTLQEIADACGFTRSLLSKIETGKTVPPVSTLTSIAGALGTTVATLVGDARQEATSFASGEDVARGPMVSTDKGYSFFAFAQGRADKLMQPFLFVAEKGGVARGGLSHSGEEFIYVLEGRMRYTVGRVAYALGPGDSLYFDGVEEHDVAPLTDVVKYLAVFVDAPRPASDVTPGGPGAPRRRRR